MSSYVKVKVNGIAYYIPEKIWADLALFTVHESTLLRNSDYAIDLKDNSLIKCRGDIEYIIDKITHIEEDNPCLRT